MPSYEQNKTSNTWSVRFRIVSKSNTINKRLSGFPRKKDAQQAYIEFMQGYVPDNAPSIELTLNQMAELFFCHQKDRIKESSLYDIKYRYYNQIKDLLGFKKVTEITKTDIVELQKKLNETNYSYNYKSILRNTVMQILGFAVRYYDLPRNVVKDVEPFRRAIKKKEMLIWSPDEFGSFIANVDDITYKALFTFLYFTGVRKGEALATTWADISPTGYLNISKSITYKSFRKGFVVTTPKNSQSIRTILLPNFLLEILCLYKQSFNFKDTDFIFKGDKPLALATITRKLVTYARKADVKVIRVHDFRHSHASLLISNGESILMVAKRLGHSDVKQTLNTYAHLLPNTESEMVDRLNSLGTTLGTKD